MNSDNPYDPNRPLSNPYEAGASGSPPPNTPYPPATNPNNTPYPYAPGNQPPPPDQYSQGQGSGAYQQYPPIPPPPGTPPYQYSNTAPTFYNTGNQPPEPRSSSGLRIGVIVLVVLVIIIGAIAIAIPVHNNQVANDNATATAQALNKATTATVQANVTATAQTNATATVVANTYPFSANLKLNDPLTDNTHGYGWQESASCSFTGGGYHNFDKSANTFLPCPALKTNFVNFTYQASMQIVKGTIGGITFRGNDAKSQFYAFVLGNDGSYAFFLYKDSGKPQTLKEGAAPQFNAGQANLIGVVARANTLDLYVNKQQVTTLTDSTYTSGQIGVIAYNVGQEGEVAYKDAQVWTL